MRPLVVVYDQGAAQPGDIAIAMDDSISCVYALAPTEQARALEPLIAQFGPVVPIAAPDAGAAELKQYHPAGIVTFSERAVPLTAGLAAALGLPYHDRVTARLLTDKWEQRSAFRRAGIDALRVHRVDTVDDWPQALAAVGLPAVLKPLNGGASRDTYLVEDADTGARLTRELLTQEAVGFTSGGSLILEEYLIGRPSEPFGDYVSIEAIVADGHVTDIAVTGKLPMIPPFRETGRFWRSPLGAAEEEDVRNLAKRAVHALGITTGLTHTEVKLTAAGPRLIEVNGRLGGGINELARRALGIDLIELAGHAALGAPIGPIPEMPRTVYFQVFNPAPRRPCRLTGIDGAEVVRGLPGVSLYRPYVKPGRHLPGGVHTQELDIVIGETADHAALAALAGDIQRSLRFHFVFEGGPENVTVTGAELANV